jgi:hypothetical protein
MPVLYLDECLDSDLLIALLRAAAYSVEYPHHARTIGWDDLDHLEFAASRGYLLLTQNVDDFLDLHDEWRVRGQAHSGIALIYQDNVRGKDMEPADIVRAVGNLLTSGIPIANEVHILNHWR